MSKQLFFPLVYYYSIDMSLRCLHAVWNFSYQAGPLDPQGQIPACERLIEESILHGLIHFLLPHQPINLTFFRFVFVNFPNGLRHGDHCGM